VAAAEDSGRPTTVGVVGVGVSVRDSVGGDSSRMESNSDVDVDVDDIWSGERRLAWWWCDCRYFVKGGGELKE